MNDLLKTMLICSALTGGVASGNETLELEGYDWRSRVSGSPETNTMYKIRLPADVIDGLRAFPMDIRIIDEDGKVWPSMIWSRSGDGPVNNIRAAELDVVVETNRVSRVYQIEPGAATGERALHNQVVVSLGGKDFVHRAEVWGGERTNAFKMLASGILVELNKPFNMRRRVINYPDTDVPFINVRIFPDNRVPGAVNIPWRTSEFARVQREVDDVDYFSVKMVEPPEGEPQREDVTEVFLETGYKNRALAFLDIDAGIANTTVPVRVYGRTRPDAGWRWIADGGLHHYGGVYQARVMMNRADYPYLKVVLPRTAEKPLRIKHVDAGAVPYYLMFTPQTSKRAYLYYGSSRYQLPAASFVRGVDEASVSDAPSAKLSRRLANPARVVGSLEEYRGTLFYLALLIVATSVVMVSIRWVRRRYLS
jgi:hypothetical protein